MRRQTCIHNLVRCAIVAAGAATLAACEVRHEGEGEDATPEPQATPTQATASPTPSPTTSAVSIIREDIEPVQPEVTPSEPVELVLPFPDGADVTPQVERMLVGVLESDAMREGWPVVLGGHTDSSGNDQANLRASRARAEAVAAWLVEHGVADARLKVIAFGEQNPLAPNARPDGTPDEAARRSNRRVELRIAPPASAANSSSVAERSPSAAN